MEQAIANDDVIWHANALNNFLELEDAALFNFSLTLATTLNRRFDKAHGTMAGKHMDVPGMSKSAIPLLAATGIRGYHIGFNGAVKKPESVPPISRWKHGGPGTEIVLMAEDNYGTKIRARGSSAMLAFMSMYQIDDTGPPTADEVLSFWTAIRTQYPAATPMALSLDGYVQKVLDDTAVFDALPVLTGEIGDSWLYGSPADPIKLATFREARRSLQGAVDAGRVQEASPEYHAFMRRLLKGPPEHNWGWATTIPVPTIGSDPWDNAGFRATKKRKPGYAVLEEEWAEQRRYCYPLTDSTSNSAPAAIATGDAADHASWRRYVDVELLPRWTCPPAVRPEPAGQAGALGRSDRSAGAAEIHV